MFIAVQHPIDRRPADLQRLGNFRGAEPLRLLFADQRGVVANAVFYQMICYSYLRAYVSLITGRDLSSGVGG